MTANPDATSTENLGPYQSVPFAPGMGVPLGDFQPGIPEAEDSSPESPSPFALPPDKLMLALHLVSERLQRLEESNAREFALVHTKLDWIGNATGWLTQMLSGVQNVAAQMGGPMGSVVRKMMGGKSGD